MLSAPSLLKILNRKLISSTRDRNPLSQLPSSTPVLEYVSEALRDTGIEYAFVFIDFANFKAYNESYGHRQGDKVIVHFSKKLKELAADAGDRFAGHFGGDRFFLGMQKESVSSVANELKKIFNEFQNEIGDFYDPATLKKGYVMALDSDGKMKKFSLITASAVVFELPEFRRRIYSVAEVTNLAARARNRAKESETKVYVTGTRDLEKFSFSRKKVLGEEK